MSPTLGRLFATAPVPRFVRHETGYWAMREIDSKGDDHGDCSGFWCCY